MINSKVRLIVGVTLIFKLDHLSEVEVRGLLAELTAPFPEHEPYLTLCYEIPVTDD